MILDIPQIINPKLYLSKHNFKNLIQNNQIQFEKCEQSIIASPSNETTVANSTTVTPTVNDQSSSPSSTLLEEERELLINNLEIFINYFQLVINNEQSSQSSSSSSTTALLLNQLNSLYSLIKEIGLFNSNLILLEIQEQQESEAIDLSYLVELIFQFLLKNNNKINNNKESVELFLILFRILSLIISQDNKNSKIYTEMLVSMGLLNYIKNIKSSINQFNSSILVDDDDGEIEGSNNNNGKLIEKIKFIINDIINQILNFNNSDNCKYLFKKLYFNSFTITLRQLLYSNVGLGYKIWDSSLLLSEIILSNSNLFKNKNVLEIGSGCGVTGIIASNYTNSIIITDYLNLINDNIKFNIDNNIQVSGNGNIKVLDLNWDKLNEQVELNNKQFDIVFGSDLIYTQTASKTVPIVLSTFLKQSTGLALLVLPKCREGINEFDNQLKLNNLNIIEMHNIKNLGDDGDLLVYLINKN